MAVNKDELAAAKDYMRIDGDDDDALIEALMEAAKVYLKNAGIELCDDPLHNLAVWSLTLHYYDHRDAVSSEAPLPTGLRPIINMLKGMNAHYPV